MIYDSFGDFEGFDLRTPHGRRRRYRAHEEEIEELVLAAWRERMVITVVAHAREPEHEREHEHGYEHEHRDDRVTRWHPRHLLLGHRTGRVHEHHHEHEHEPEHRERPATPIRIILRRTSD